MTMTLNTDVASRHPIIASRLDAVRMPEIGPGRAKLVPSQLRAVTDQLSTTIDPALEDTNDSFEDSTPRSLGKIKNLTPRSVQRLPHRFSPPLADLVLYRTTSLAKAPPQGHLSCTTERERTPHHQRDINCTKEETYDDDPVTDGAAQ